MLLQWAMRVYAEADQPYYIISPRRRLLTAMGIGFLLWTVLWTFTYTHTAILTIPLLAYVGFAFFLFARVWDAYKYSRLYTICIPLIAFLLSVLFKYLIYQYVS